MSEKMTLTRLLTTAIQVAADTQATEQKVIAACQEMLTTEARLALIAELASGLPNNRPRLMLGASCAGGVQLLRDLGGEPYWSVHQDGDRPMVIELFELQIGGMTFAATQRRAANEAEAAQLVNAKETRYLVAPIAAVA